jgi:hypothetical protein
MPRCLHPDDTFPIVLKSDEHFPLAEQPFFSFRALSILKWRSAMKIIQMMENLDTENPENVGPAIDAICEVLRMGLVGWGNMLDHNVAEGAEPIWIPYDPTKLDDLIDLGEAMELMKKMMDACQVTPADKKKLGSQRTSARAASVGHARNGASTRQRR